jgi:crotonobetainyl-CoA:carnitine CoA-transferase CaiB-like acyl-CoA transferase
VDLTATTILRQEPQKMTAGVARSSNPLVGPYSTRDGRYLILNMLDDTRHWAPLCRALGLDALIDDPRYFDTAARAENAVALHTAITEAIRSHDLADAREMLKREDTIFSALQSPLETIDDPQVVENGYLAPHPSHPTARLACAPMQFDDERITVRRAAPGIGEHTDEVLVEAGFSDDEIATLRKVGAAGAA